MNSRKSRTKGEKADVVALSLRIQPRASKNEIITMENGGLKVRLTAPPVDNAANEALIRLLAETLAVSRSRIEIISGHTSRDKIIRIHGITEADAKRILNTKRE
jgi:uncharacterized protein (TIGR00251 family)